MSEETETKAQVAGSIMAMAIVPISIKVAMHHAGFSQKEIENRSLQQKVRRKGMKAPPSTISFTPSNESSPVSTFSHSQSASSITPTIRQDSIPSNSILFSSILPSSGSIHRQSRSRTRRANEDLIQSNQHLQTLFQLSQQPQAEGEDGEDSKLPAKKKSRKSSVQRQKTDAEACLLNKKQSDAFKLATSRYALSLTLKMGDPEKKSCKIICDEVNEMKGTSVSKTTVARAIREGRAGASPLKRGKVASIPKSEWTSLKDAYSTFIMLEQANKRDECTPKKLRRLVGQCLQAGGYLLEMEEITRRLRRQTAHIISAGKGNPQELRRLVWTDANGVVDADPVTTFLLALEKANHLACDHLSAQGCNGDQLKSFSPRVLAGLPVTEPYRRERQDAIVMATTAGKHYHATGGNILNSDDFFIAYERSARQKEAAILGKEKKARLAAKQRQEDASAIIADLEKRSVDVYDDKTNLKPLLGAELKGLVAWKLGGEKVPTTKEPLIASWMKSKKSDKHSSFEEWTRDDEARLARLLDDDIKLGETEYGRQQDVIVQSLRSTAGSRTWRKSRQLSRSGKLVLKHQLQWLGQLMLTLTLKHQIQN